MIGRIAPHGTALLKVRLVADGARDPGVSSSDRSGLVRASPDLSSDPPSSAVASVVTHAGYDAARVSRAPGTMRVGHHASRAPRESGTTRKEP